jgi:hypothetical protein
MIYVHKVGVLNAEEGEALDIKAAWKAISPSMIRRTDRFIQLSLLGAYQAVGQCPLSKDTALYMASGQGNLAVFKRLRDQRYIKKQPPKPVDFINSLSNTSGFYVAQFLGIDGKNLNVSRLGLVAETTLLLAQNDLELGREQEILVGGVDELQEPATFTRRTLGLCDDRLLGEGSNWMLLSTEKEGALSTLNVIKQTMDVMGLTLFLKGIEGEYNITFGQRTPKGVIEEVMQSISKDIRLFEMSVGFYETVSLYFLNSFIQKGEGKLIYIEMYHNRFRVIQVDNLPEN